MSSWRSVPDESRPIRPAAYVAALDGLRGIAILAVVFHNTVEAIASSHDRLTHYLLALAGPGWIAVQLFFVLSGFLIAGELWTIYTGTIFRLDALALGAAGGCLVRIESTAAILPRHCSAAVAVASLMLLCGAYLTHSYDFSTLACESYGYTLLAIAGALVVGAVGAPSAAGGQRQPRFGQWLSVLPLRAIGRCSFGIYVFHGVLNKLVAVPLVRHFLPTPISGGAVTAYAATIFVVSLALAALSYEFFESAFLNLKPRFRF